MCKIKDISGRVFLFEKIFYYAYMFFLAALFFAIFLFGFGYLNYFWKEKQTDEWKKSAENVLPAKSDNAVEYQEYNSDTDQKHIKPFPDFIVDTIPSDELEILKP